MKIVLDGSLMTDRAAVHDQLAAKFKFPDYYGRNLDALYDLLAVYPDPVDVTFLHGVCLQENLGSYGKSLLCTLREAAAYNSKVKLSILDEII